MLRRSALCATKRVALGMVLDDEGPCDFTTAAGRRKLQLAYSAHHDGTMHDIRNAQLRHVRSPPHQRLHIMAHVSASTPGFQSFAKLTPDKFVVHERRVDCDAATQGTKHEIAASQQESSIVRQATADRVHMREEFIQQMYRDVDEIARHEAAALCVELRRHEPRRLGRLGLCDDDDAGERLNAAFTHRLQRSHVRRLQAAVDKCLAASSAANYGRIAETISCALSLAIQHNEGLSKAFPLHLVSVPPTLDSCGAAVDGRLVRIRRVMSDDVVRSLLSFFSECAFADVVAEITSAVDDAGHFEHRLEPKRVSLPWRHERLVHASHLTGTVLRSPTDKERGYSRGDVKSATVKQIYDAMQALNEGNLLPKRVTLSADLDFLHLSWKLSGRAHETSKRITDGERNKDVLVQIPPAKELMVSTWIVPFTVVECILEKKGLPHKFVVDDMTEELSQMMRTALSAQLGERLLKLVLPRVVVTTHTRMDMYGWSRQYVRVRGSTAEHVEKLMNQLKSGSYFTKAPPPPLDAKEMPHMSFTSRRNAGAKRDLTGSRLPGWSRRSKPAVNSVDPATRGPQVMGLNAANILTDEDRAFWAENYYQLHCPKLLFEAALEVDSKKVDMLAAAKGRAELEGERKALESRLAEFDLRSAEGVVHDYRVALSFVKRADLEKAVPTAIASTQLLGFVNYFGPSRFSSFSRKNQHPGLHLLRGEYQAAGSIIASNVPPHDDDDAVDSVSAGGLATASRLLREAMKQTSDGYGTDESQMDVFHQVLGLRFMRMLVMEFVCFVWNDLVSQRIKRCGPRALLEGDLVAQPQGEKGRRSTEVAVATRSDIDKGVYTFRDLVLPIPGSNVILPQNDTGTMILQHLKSSWGISANPETHRWDIFEGKAASGDESDEVDEAEDDYAILTHPLRGSLDPTRRPLKGNALGIQLPGAYRRVYGDASSLETTGITKEDHSSSAALAGDLEITFTLPSSAYVSMLLRELTKLDVNSADQLDLFGADDATPKAKSWDHLSSDDKHLYSRYLRNKKKVRDHPPEAMVLAQLHRQIFKAGGMRKSLLPSMKGFNDVAK